MIQCPFYIYKVQLMSIFVKYVTNDFELMIIGMQSRVQVTCHFALKNHEEIVQFENSSQVS